MTNVMQAVRLYLYDCIHTVAVYQMRYYCKRGKQTTGIILGYSIYTGIHSRLYTTVGRYAVSMCSITTTVFEYTCKLKCTQSIVQYSTKFYKVV